MIGQWLFEEDHLEQSMEHIANVVQNDCGDLEAWKLWLQENFQLSSRNADPQYPKNSLEAAFRGLQISSDNPLPFMLKILSILFRRDSGIRQLFVKRLREIPSAVWLEVLPQMLSQINSSEDTLKFAIQKLLYVIGTEHPQIAFTQLSVALRSDNQDRRDSLGAMVQGYGTVLTCLQLATRRVASETTLAANATQDREVFRNLPGGPVPEGVRRQPDTSIYYLAASEVDSARRGEDGRLLQDPEQHAVSHPTNRRGTDVACTWGCLTVEHS
jgi:hypothetical protein